MIPNVFISSTIEDLQHLRDGIRDTIEELGYTPIMSEYGDVGYLPAASAQDSCYHSIRECQLALVILGKRYGSVTKDGRSVTHNEFLNARDHHIPVVTLVDQEVLSYKRVYDAHPTERKPDCFPGMDDPPNSFRLVQEIMDAPVNNGILAYGNVTDARQHVKRQIAHIFGELLANAFNPLNSGIKDVISEIKTLRHELSGGSQPDFRFLSAIRYLVDDGNNDLRKLIEHTVGPIDTAIPSIFAATAFDDFLQRNGFTLDLVADSDDPKGFFEGHDLEYGSSRAVGVRRTPEEKPLLAHWGVSRQRKVIMNAVCKEVFDRTFDRMKKITGVPNKTSEATLGSAPGAPPKTLQR